jgi:conjugative transfer pilus assembly protein TraH
MPARPARLRGMTARAILAVFLLALAPAASAGLNEEMQSMFSDMVNVTPADAYTSQRRGVLSGGSIVMRNKIVNPSLVSFVPPSFKGGCNGVDLFGGSFSFINAEQLTQLLRNIAQAAIGYAFQLAIEGMCPTCAQVMSKLQQDIAKINSLMRNSCEFAKGMVNKTGLKAWHDSEMKDATDLNAKQGFIADWFDGQENNGAKSPSQVAIAHGRADELKGNVVKEALDQASAMDWYASGTGDMQMVLMSLTGTLVIGTKDGAAADGGTDLDYRFVPPILKVRDFIEGGNLLVYHCPDTKCTDPSQQAEAVTGMRDRVRGMLFGTGVCAACAGGIVRKLGDRTSGAALTPAEQAFIQATSPGAMGLLFKVAAEPGSAGLVADRMVDVLAVELTHQIVDEMFDTVRNAVTSTGRPMDTSMLDVLRDLRGQINEQRRVAGESTVATSSLIDIYANVVKNLHRKTPEAGGD